MNQTAIATGATAIDDEAKVLQANKRAAEAMRKAQAGTLSLNRLSVAERIEHISLLRKIILERREDIIDRIQRDTGKSRSDALISEIFGVLDALAWIEKFALELPLLSGHRADRLGAGDGQYGALQAVGVDTARRTPRGSFPRGPDRAQLGAGRLR
jgi:acyl-CoA reductase-like NAD-dependent aldehyde dehydrogenase